MMRSILITSSAAALIALAGCGQKGPLVPSPGATTPAAATPPAPLPPGAQRPADQTLPGTDPTQAMNDTPPAVAVLPDWLTRDGSGRLLADGLDLDALAKQFGTPLYLYSRAHIESTFEEFRLAVKGRKATICYALKANSNLAIIELMGRLGCGFDIVSGGELERVIAAGCDPQQVLFSGVGKSAAEMARALEVGVRCFNVESLAELERLDEVAAGLGRIAPVSIRVNPDVDAATHPYISTGLRENKFGVAFEEALPVYRRAAELAHVEVTGIDCHIGSQITEIAPFLEALDRVLEMVDQLKRAGIEIRHLDLGGGLGIRYDDEVPPDPMALMTALFRRIDQWSSGEPPEVLFEFGRALVGNAGVAAHPHRIPQAQPRQELRGRRCRDERPDPAFALRCLSPDRARRAARRRRTALRHRRSGLRIGRLAWARPPAGRSSRATCWRSCPPAPTAR